MYVHVVYMYAGLYKKPVVPTYCDNKPLMTQDCTAISRRLSSSQKNFVNLHLVSHLVIGGDVC